MKKSFKRIIATIMAISTAAVSGLSVTANAANEASDAELTKIAEQAVMENMAAIAKSSEPFYYPPDLACSKCPTGTPTCKSTSVRIALIL